MLRDKRTKIVFIICVCVSLAVVITGGVGFFLSQRSSGKPATDSSDSSGIDNGAVSKTLDSSDTSAGSSNWIEGSSSGTRDASADNASDPDASSDESSFSSDSSNPSDDSSNPDDGETVPDVDPNTGKSVTGRWIVESEDFVISKMPLILNDDGTVDLDGSSEFDGYVTMRDGRYTWGPGDLSILIYCECEIQDVGTVTIELDGTFDPNLDSAGGTATTTLKTEGYPAFPQKGQFRLRR